MRMNMTLKVDLLNAQSEQVRMQQKIKDSLEGQKALKETLSRQEGEIKDLKKERSKSKKQLQNYEQALKEYKGSGKQEIKKGEGTTVER